MHLKMGVDRPETATVQKAEERVFFFWFSADRLFCASGRAVENVLDEDAALICSVNTVANFFSSPSHICYIVLHVQLPPFRSSVPRSHEGQPPSPQLRCLPSFLSPGEFNRVLPSSTGV